MHATATHNDGSYRQSIKTRAVLQCAGCIEDVKQLALSSQLDAQQRRVCCKGWHVERHVALAHLRDVPLQSGMLQCAAHMDSAGVQQLAEHGV